MSLKPTQMAGLHSDKVMLHSTNCRRLLEDSSSFDVRLAPNNVMFVLPGKEIQNVVTTERQ